MTDIALIVANPTDFAADDNFVLDIALIGADLASDDGMNTAICLSLFTDARADDDDVLPVAGGDRRGWWGDAYADTPGDVTGSKLWLLERAKQTPDVLVRAQQYAQDALAWMIEDGVAATIAVTASFPLRGWLALSVVITRPTGPGRQHFDYVWKTVA
jgi:phage gp46-like protein